MTTNTNKISRLAVALGMVVMFAIGGAKPSLADLNDGGPFNYTPDHNASVRSDAPVYREPQGNRRTNNVRRNTDTYTSYGRDGDWAPAPTSTPSFRYDFPRGAQGGP